MALFSAPALALAAEPTTYTGTPVTVGNGTAHLVVSTTAAGDPASVSVVLSRAALEGLPNAEPGRMAWEFTVPMPEDGPYTGFDHVVLDWNPAGHPPSGVYSVPHFDVHFYLITPEERETVSFQGADRDQALAPPEAALVPAGYVVPPDTAVEHMGLHGVDPAGGEFHGAPFSHTFIYGYYKGALTFVEPMVSLAFLQSRPEVTTAVAKPLRYSYPGWYPTGYRIGFDAGRDEITVSLQNLERFNGF
ncbi:DUF5602 domain-containing protein [Marinobacter sp. C2H3]|uniref:DUF5602 domain-containing protein n=1 Tax=Marinobacter sp. C2H3 TaxID=3119003 RepID=UPI00300EECF7